MTYETDSVASNASMRRTCGTRRSGVPPSLASSRDHRSAGRSSCSRRPCCSSRWLERSPSACSSSGPRRPIRRASTTRTGWSSPRTSAVRSSASTRPRARSSSWPRSPDCEPRTYLPIETAWSSDGQRLAYGLWRECGGCLDQSEPAGAWVYDVPIWRRASGSVNALRWHARRSTSPPMAPWSRITPRACSNGRDSLVVVEVESGSRTWFSCPARREAQPSPPTGAGSCSRFGEATSGLYVVDTTRIAQLPLEPTLLYAGGYSGEAGQTMVDASNVAWSRDGEWIAFDQVSGDGTSGVWVIRADGTDARLLGIGPAEEGPGFPTWSPDSRSIAYARTPSIGINRGERFELWTVPFAGGPPSRIYQSDCCPEDWSPPAWSPDGRIHRLLGLDARQPGGVGHGADSPRRNGPELAVRRAAAPRLAANPDSNGGLIGQASTDPGGGSPTSIDAHRLASSARRLSGGAK